MINLTNEVVLVNFFSLFLSHLDSLESFALFKSRLEEVPFLDQGKGINIIQQFLQKTIEFLLLLAQESLV